MSGVKLARRGTRHAPADVRRAQILDAALACIAASGHVRATIDDVARASGLSKGSVYRFFSSKDQILLALFDMFNDQIEAAFADDSSPTTDVFARLEQMGRSVFDTLCARRELLAAWLELLAHRDLRDRLAEVYRRSRHRVSALVQQGIEAGEIRAESADSAAATLVAVVEGLVLQTVMDRSFDARTIWPDIWQTLRQGLST